MNLITEAEQKLRDELNAKLDNLRASTQRINDIATVCDRLNAVGKVRFNAVITAHTDSVSAVISANFVSPEEVTEAMRLAGLEYYEEAPTYGGYLEFGGYVWGIEGLADQVILNHPAESLKEAA